MSNMTQRLLLAASLISITCFGVAPFNAWGNVEVPENSGHAWSAPNAPNSLLLAVSGQKDQSIWVAGERGHILRQDNNTLWQQANVPTQVLLTAIEMLDGQYGWAAGHDAIILKTRDGGLTWQEVYKNSDEQRPLFDVLFRDTEHGIAVGAYGYYLYTRDGGRTWQDKLVNEDHDFHLNAISQNPDGELYIAAEAGNVYRSVDFGENWTTLSSPYEGSFFDVLAWGDSHVALAGLRGNLYLSDDKGESWRKIPSIVETSLNSLTRLRNGQLLAVGHAGVLLLVSADFSRAMVYQLPDRKALSDVYEHKYNQVLLVGESGITALNLCDAFQAKMIIGCL